MNPRVGHILQPEYGGVPNYVAQLVRGLEVRGWHSSVAASPRVSSLFEPDAFWPFEVTRGPAPIADLRSVRLVRQWIRRERIDVAHTHSTKAGLIGGFSASSLGVPIVHSPHAWPFQIESSGLARRSYVGWERFATRRLRAQVIAVGAAEREAGVGAGLPESRIRVVPTGLPRVSGTDRQGARARLRLPRDARVVAWIGRDAPQKRPQDLVPLARQLTAAGVSLVVMGQGVGDGENAAAITRAGGAIAASRDARQLISACDVLVHTAAWEGLPLVLLEAMQAGRPVVAYNCAGVAEVVVTGETGRLVPVGDVDALGREVVDLLQDSSALRRMSAAAARRSQACFDYDAMVDGVIATYEAVLPVPRQFSVVSGNVRRHPTDERSA